MAIKSEITMTNKLFYSLIAVCVFLALCVGVLIYRGSISEIVTVENTECWAHGFHTLEVNCSDDYKLLGCQGGPGDLLERNEGWYITPDFSQNKCILKIKEPACNPGDEDTVKAQRIIALCYR